MSALSHVEPRTITTEPSLRPTRSRISATALGVVVAAILGCEPTRKAGTIVDHASGLRQDESSSTHAPQRL